MDDFGLQLILAEEMRQPVQQPPAPDERDEPTRSIVYEETGVTSSGAFYLTPEDEGAFIDGPGSVDNILIVADSDQFSVAVDTEDATLVDHQFTTLQTNSAELSHVAAYERSDGKFICSVSDFPFRERASATVTAHEQVTFDRLRAVFTVGSEVDY